MSFVSKFVNTLMETGYVPERITKLWMKYLCFRANKNASFGNVDARNSVFRQIHRDLMSGENLQSREFSLNDSIDMPLSFYQFFMGSYMNFASGYFSTGAEDLDEAEETALWMAADKARIRDGMSILEIGTNNGAFATYLAKNYPTCNIIALTDSEKALSRLQKVAADQGLENLNYVNQNFENIQVEKEFDRVVCLERFDLIGSVPNWEKKIKSLLKNDGYFFLQTPVHYSYAYYPDSVGLENYPGKDVIKDLIQPNFKNLMLTNSALHLCDCWEQSGEHYKQTAKKWYKKFVFNKDPIYKVLIQVYGSKEAKKWYERWRLFLLGQYEKFGYNKGQYWVIGQYLYR